MRVNKPASALDKLRSGLEGPLPSSLVRLHELAGWLDQAVPVSDRVRAEGMVRRELLARDACTVYVLEPGQAPKALQVAGLVPVVPGRRQLSRGLAGGAAPAPAPTMSPGNPRAWALQQADLQLLAVSRAAAAELFGYPPQVEAAPAPATEPALAAPPAATQVADDPNPLGTLRDKVKTLTPIRKPTGSRFFPKGVDWKAELLRHYELCKTDSVTMEEVEAELGRLWGMAQETVHTYVSQARGSRTKLQPGASRRNG